MTSTPPFTGKTPLVVEAQSTHTATIIFSQSVTLLTRDYDALLQDERADRIPSRPYSGLGDTALGWLDFAQDLAPKFPHVKWILTNAPQRYIKLWDESMPSWSVTNRSPRFERVDEKPLPLGAEPLSVRRWDFKIRNAPPQDEDSQGMLESVETIKQLIEIEVANGIDPGRIVVGGFSQGCVFETRIYGSSVLSILTTVTSTRPLAGTMALSGYLGLTYKNHIDSLATDVGRNIPMLMAHGDQDAIITLEKSRKGHDHLKSIGFEKIDYRVYKGEHSEKSIAQLSANPVDRDPKTMLTRTNIRCVIGLAHSLGQQETLDIIDMLKKVIP
ncbi:BQ2448_2490 [Microbotryum intermedium]|uniref:Acyl-protein thioesterase 1 n=1 Tax=Microbotryum intermedium TaxID=269621 RepID=A0A238F6H5_9BASI|nr:BQ2448_2490 [Microbotryum intermedium]